MTDWLQSNFHNGLDISTATLATRLILAFVFGVAVASLYRWTQGAGESCQALASTLVLLAILIALVTQVIGNSVARAFSLVGALSLVRFRTEVQDTRDTAFVIFAVVIGMASGAGHLLAACVGTLVAGMAAIATRPTPLSPAALGARYNLTVKLGLGQNAEGLLQRFFEKYLDAYRLLATTTARQGAAFELTYSARLRPECSPAELVRELNQLEGIQAVSLSLA
ncbi:MAG TPA: DUF4956 domain-containing protein [Terriglobia bacterium]|nr:DUF4956 domain-containing protein [Terriglobia bacterium]